MSLAETDQWIADVLALIATDEKYENRMFDKVIYWRLDDSHNVTIKRDKVWFAESFPKLQHIWSQVVFFRQNKDKLELLVKFINSLEKKVDKEIMKMVERLCDPKQPDYQQFVDKLKQDLVNVKGIMEPPKENNYVFKKKFDVNSSQNSSGNFPTKEEPKYQSTWKDYKKDYAAKKTFGKKDEDFSGYMFQN